jgi:hypothetical protein
VKTPCGASAQQLNRQHLSLVFGTLALIGSRRRQPGGARKAPSMNWRNSEVCPRPLSTNSDINNIFFKFPFIIFFNLFLIMGRYVLNTTKYVLKWPKKHQKVPKFNKITLSTLSDPPPPPRLIHIFKINNIHTKEYLTDPV